MEIFLNYLLWFTVGMAGMILQVLIKLNSLKAKAKIANEAFSYKSYFQTDWLSLAAGVVTILLTMLLIDETFLLSPRIQYFVKWIFAFVGYTGSDIMTRIFGVMNKQFNDAINEKTNIADALKDRK